MKPAFLSAILCCLLLPAPLSAQGSANTLSFFKNYFVSGDYIVGGVGLRGTGVNGIASGTIDLTNASIPGGVDILAAFLYWETIETPNSATGTSGATFRGHDISTIARAVNPAGTAPCWSSGGLGGESGGAHRMITYRADVLRFLPLETSGPHVGKHLVKTSHPVGLPDRGKGNAVPSTAGATLVVIYRDQSLPLRAIVIYDGGATLSNQAPVLSQTLKGFYEGATPAGRVTHIVGDGQPNFPERLLFNGQVIATNPFVGALGPAADPAWDTLTFDVTAGPGGFVDAVTTTVDNVGFNSADCLSWGAIIFSTTVKDTDQDGLLDIWETSESLSDPTGQPLPNLKAMGADKNVKDLFVEVGYLSTPGYSHAVQGQVPAHSHLPAEEALTLVGNVFKNAPSRINVHFDVGNHYQGNPFVVPYRRANGSPCTSALDTQCLARGGEEIVEYASCTTPSSGPAGCAFPDQPGTVGWKSAFNFFKNQPLSHPTVPGAASAEEACVAAGAACQRRFDRNRKDIFHYALYAHALGLPPSKGVSAKTSGIADLLGGDMLVTLGYWDDFVGTPFMQASTTAHELGHNLGLRHGGRPLEFNCKPNYQSVMNYLFQARGLTVPVGQPGAGSAALDFSRDQLPALNPNALTDAAIPGLRYYTRWYAPKASSFIDAGLGTTAASRHCNGSPLTEGVDFVRVDGTTLSATDWNANGSIDSSPFAQDISFNGILSGNPPQFPVLNAGANDFGLMDFRQVGSRRNAGSPRGDADGGGMSLDLGFADVGFADVGFGDVGFADVGFADVGFADVGFADVGFGDVGFGDVGTGDLGFADVGAPPGEIDLETATSLGNSPSGLKATVTSKTITLDWKAPPVASVNFYNLYRVIGTGITASNFGARVLVGTALAPSTTIVDTTTKNNVVYTYFVVATFFDATQSGISNLVTASR